eukprot:4682543-Pyramimonas_sp.AAC.1
MPFVFGAKEQTSNAAERTRRSPSNTPISTRCPASSWGRVTVRNTIVPIEVDMQCCQSIAKRKTTLGRTETRGSPREKSAEMLPLT